MIFDSAPVVGQFRKRKLPACGVAVHCCEFVAMKWSQRHRATGSVAPA
jgi:hypothetical protein